MEEAYNDEAAKTASNGNESRRKNVQGDRRGNRRDAGCCENVYVPLQKSEGEKKVRMLLDRRLLKMNEFMMFEKKMCEKYGLPQTSIFRDESIIQQIRFQKR